MKDILRYFMSISLIAIFLTNIHADFKNVSTEQDIIHNHIRYIPDTYLTAIDLRDEEKEPESEGWIPTISVEDAELIALVTMAEAEGECEEGKRLVIDTILNRVDHDRFPDTIYEVIYQKNQFTSMWNGRINRCYVRDDILELVYQEVENRYNYDVIFFRTSHYSAYGSPLFKVGNHYFSKY